MSRRFFIVNRFDRPAEQYIAERRKDGTFYYVHPRLRSDRRYHAMTPQDPTEVEAFGVRLQVADGVLSGVFDSYATPWATYSDGRPRRWQGSLNFSFSLGGLK